MSFIHRRIVMNADRIDRALRRIADEIVEHSGNPEKIALIGIRTGGVNITARIAEHLKSSENLNVPIGMLDITL